MKTSEIIRLVPAQPTEPHDSSSTGTGPAADAVIRALPVPAAILRRDRGRIVCASAALGRLIGVPVTALAGRSALSLVATAEDRRRLRQWIGVGALPREMEIRLRHIDGRSLPVMAEVAEVDHGGEFLMVALADLAQRQREVDLRLAKEQAELANASKSEFLANMSHELRTPLNAVIGFADIIMRQLFGPLGSPRYSEYASDIYNSGQHLLEVINDVLDMSKIEAGEMSLAESVVDVGRTIEVCLRLMRERALRQGVVLEGTPAVDTAPLAADERKLKQILLNLLSNAIKFTPSGGRVVVAAEHAADGRLCLSVSDTGVGMSEAEIGLALIAFRQVDSSLARKYPGTGLGLPISKALVEMHGGTMDIRSTPGAGTTVRVAFPASRLMAADRVAV